MKVKRKNKFIGKCKNCGKKFYRNSKYSNKQLTKAEFCSRRCANSGRFSLWWKGGKYKTGQGYVKIKMRDHPFCDSEGYVMEHRLKMERKLGRFLSKKEAIHHRNGVTSDNRLKNLELFSENIQHLLIAHNFGFRKNHSYGNRFKKGHVPWNKN